MLSPFVRALSIASKKKKIQPKTLSRSLLPPHRSLLLYITFHPFILSVLLTTRSFIYLYSHHHFDCNLRAMNPVPANKKIIFHFPLIYYNFFFASLSHSLTLYTSASFSVLYFPFFNCSPTLHIFVVVFSTPHLLCCDILKKK